ncbi:MAG TPA: hypothetical protein VGI54_04015, partial [Solirubrobacteraceae bacterium]
AALAVPAAAQAPPSRLLLTAREYSLALSRPALRPGPAIVELLDRGEDPHDVALRKLKGSRAVGRTRHIPETRAGGLTTVRWNLKAGRYLLWCTLPQHRRLGMHVVLNVRKPRAKPRPRRR